MTKPAHISPYHAPGFYQDAIAAGRHRDIVGGRSSAYEKVLNDARQTAISDMTEMARSLGANAVIGIDIDYETIGSSGSMLKSAGSNSPSITAIAGASMYSTPVAQTPTPTLPVQCGTPVVRLKKSRIASSSAMNTSDTYRNPSVAPAGVAPS